MRALPVRPLKPLGKAVTLLKFLKITNKSESLIPLYSHGASVSDNYWCKRFIKRKQLV